MYTYKISILYLIDKNPVHNEISYSFSNTLHARHLAIQELKKVLDIAKNQLYGREPHNRYFIPEWDNPDLISDTPELNTILRPFSVTLSWIVGNTEYILYGDGIADTIEALITEAQEYESQHMVKEQDLTGLLLNKDFIATPGNTQQAYVLTDNLYEIPDFRFSQYSILKADREFLLNP